jgi:hypothetical protein
MKGKKLGREVEKEREKFLTSTPKSSHSSIFFVPFQVSFGYMVLMDYVLLVVKREISPTTLKKF